jgi:hypothetical protein
MKKYLLLVLTTIAFGQKPFSRQNAHNTFAVKGFAYLNFLAGGYGGEIGLEKGFAKQHSIGIKYVYDVQTPHKEASKENNINLLTTAIIRFSPTSLSTSIILILNSLKTIPGRLTLLYPIKEGPERCKMTKTIRMTIITEP